MQFLQMHPLPLPANNSTLTLPHDSHYQMTRPNFPNLRIGHLNVRGLEHHVDGVKLLLDNSQYHFFAVTETKLKSSAPVGPVRIPAYNFIKHSLPAGRGRGTKSCGGVGIYVKKGLKATPVIRSTHDVSLPIAARVEYLVIQVKVNDLNLGVCVLYNPSCSNQHFSQCYEKVLIEMLDFGFDRMYVVGDFNINVAASLVSSYLAALRRINESFNLSVLPTGATGITDTSSSTIDLLITDCPQLIKKSKAVPTTISDHELVFLLADIRVRSPPPQAVRVRNFRNIDTLRLQGDFQAIDWQRYYGSTDVNAKTELLTSELESLLQVHAPERTILVRDKRTPWITSEIKQAIELRNLAFKLYSRNPNRTRGDVQWQEFIRKRDRASSLIFEAKKRYAELHFDHNLPAKKLWCNLRREGIHNSTKQCSPSDEVDVDELNRFFSDGHRQLQSRDQNCTSTEPLHRTAVDHGAMEFNFRNTNTEEVCRKIFEIQTNAAGSDNIPISFIKMMCPFILPLLCHLFNTIIETHTFPSLWKTAIVTPIPKTSNPTTPKDFRPISVLPAVSKVLEKILLGQISEHLDNPNARLLARNQSGYRKGFSTTTALAKVVHDVYSNFENSCTIMVLVDFSLAFNCVDHRMLRTKLNEEFLFSRTACDLVSSFLGERHQTVRVGDKMSAVREVTDGTPQGSCLSALLFSLYINNLPTTLSLLFARLPTERPKAPA
ncbi:hypothetical protein RP20_CCG010352 [Aedes albopictus]|nr:hypothetical protein RP20_CCG010352 [Aedes albopictus]